MLQHPGVILAEYLKENWYTQKDFSKKIGKKTSEINELIRWKRNITVARDIILTKYLSTKPKFWILKQVDFDYEQMLLKDWEMDVIMEDNNRYSLSTKNAFDNKQNSEQWNTQKTLQDIIDEERLQSKYLRENVFQETPIYEEEKEDEKGDVWIVQRKDSVPIKDLLKEDPIQESTPLSELFNSF